VPQNSLVVGPNPASPKEKNSWLSGVFRFSRKDHPPFLLVKRSIFSAGSNDKTIRASMVYLEPGRRMALTTRSALSVTPNPACQKAPDRLSL
jgi:hypothetical protein